MSQVDLAQRLEALRIRRDPVRPSLPAEPAGRANKAYIALALLASAATGAGLVAILPGISANGGAASAEASAPAAPVTLSAQAPGDLVASGFVVPRRSATVGAQITGQLRTIEVREGERVVAGQIVARLDSAAAEAALSAARADVAVANAAVAGVQVQQREARQSLRRLEALLARGFVTRAAFEAAVARAATLDAQVAEAGGRTSHARANVRAAEIALEHHVIRAPFSGVVINKNAEVGEVVSPVSAGGGFTRTGVITLVDMASLGVDVDVSEAYIAQVRLGQDAELTLDAYPRERFRASVAAIVPSADRSRATVRVGIEIIGLDPRILPQMAAKVRFRGNREHDGRAQ